MSKGCPGAWTSQLIAWASNYNLLAKGNRGDNKLTDQYLSNAACGARKQVLCRLKTRGRAGALVGVYVGGCVCHFGFVWIGLSAVRLSGADMVSLCPRKKGTQGLSTLIMQAGKKTGPASGRLPRPERYANRRQSVGRPLVHAPNGSATLDDVRVGPSETDWYQRIAVVPLCCYLACVSAECRLSRCWGLLKYSLSLERGAWWGSRVLGNVSGVLGSRAGCVLFGSRTVAYSIIRVGARS